MTDSDPGSLTDELTVFPVFLCDVLLKPVFQEVGQRKGSHHLAGMEFLLELDNLPGEFVVELLVAGELSWF